MRGYFDGDGHPYIYERADGTLRTRVDGRSVNKRGLEEVRSLLEDQFEIKSKVYPHFSEKHLRERPEDRERQAYTLVISGYENLRKFREEIGFDSPEKREKLDRILKYLGRRAGKSRGE